MVTVMGGRSAPVSSSLQSLNWSRRPLRSSPSTRAMFISTPASANTFCSASRQARGFTPPALLITLIFFSLISRASGAITWVTKSWA